MNNPLTTLVNLLRGDSSVADAVGAITAHGQTFVAVVGGEIDDAIARQMPRRLVLLENSGGFGPAEQTPVGYPRFEVTCYGKDPGGVHDASELSMVVYTALQGAQDRLHGLEACVMEAGPSTGREPNTKWPYDLRVFTLIAEA